MVVIATYGLLFRGLLYLGTAPWLVGTITIFTTGVGLGQAVVFRGTRPREASFLVGAVLCPVMAIVAIAGYAPWRSGIPTVGQLLSTIVYLTLAGAGLGYFAGCVAAGVFYVIKQIRRLGPHGQTCGDPSTSKTDDADVSFTPAFADRLWCRILSGLCWISPFQKGRPVREASNTFLLTLVLFGPILPFVNWTQQFQALAILLAGASLFAYWFGGVRVAGWKATLMFVLVAAVGARGPARLVQELHWYGRRIVDDFGHARCVIASLMAGAGIGLSAAALYGWGLWLVQFSFKVVPRRRIRATIGIVTLGLIAVCHGGLMLWAYRLSQRPEQKVLTLVHRLGGYAYSQLQTMGPQPTNILLGGRSVTDDALERICILQGLVELELTHTQITDRSLAHLKPLRRLRVLHLEATNISDAGLKHLEGMPVLAYLTLSNTQITDAGLQSLARLPSLTDLRLDNTQISDQGLRFIAGMTSLRSLSLRNTQVTDQGLAHLKNLPQLRALRLGHCPVTDEGLSHVAGMSLWALDLDSTRITDEGLVHLKAAVRWPGFESLQLRDTEISDRGLIHLQNSPSLRRLDLRGTKITKDGLSRLRQNLPNSCDIQSDFWQW